MRKNPFLILLLLFFGASQLTAQVNITVLDSRDNSALAQVQIIHQESSSRWFTNADGKAQIQVQLPTQFTFQLIGYKELTINLSENQTNPIVYLVAEDILLDAIMVRAFESDRPLFEQAAGVHFLDKKSIQRFQESNLVPVLNMLPGVRMEERSPASYRVGIRGSSLRSPFGVRNIKVYWNEIPLTEPGGNTPLNLLETDNVDNIEVIKGPAGSVYGAGTGGALLFSKELVEEGFRANASSMAGSFGLQKYSLGVQNGGENGGFELQTTWQKGDGYREHSSFERKTIQLNGTVEAGRKGELNAFLLLSDLNYQTPGGLNAAQRSENPKLARPGSADQQAGILQQYALSGLGYQLQLNPDLQVKATGYINASYFENPFILDYKRDAQSGIGGRMLANWQVSSELKISAGAEYQQSLVLARNFGNRGGRADTLRFDDELRTSQSLIFAQADYELPANFIFTAGLSINSLSFDIYRLWDAALQTSYQFDRNFNGIAVPRLALLKKIGYQHALHASWSKGFSPPTIQEVRTNEGSLNLGLEPEKGTNWELGYRFRSMDNRLMFEANYFHFILDQTIVTRTNSDGVVLFNNAGSTLQNGLEMMLSWQALKKSFDRIGIRLGSSYTYHDFTFRDYLQNQNDFTGNKLTGVAPHTWVITADIDYGNGYFLNLTHNFTDAIPLNDGNSVYSNAYHLVQLKMGKTITSKNATWEIFAGGDNLLNETYSLGNDLNAFGGRFFQPAPERNYFGGIKIMLGNN
ncbi:TonB-dependent receptor [Peijinzhouia sedimentorum]